MEKCSTGLAMLIIYFVVSFFCGAIMFIKYSLDIEFEDRETPTFRKFCIDVGKIILVSFIPIIRIYCLVCNNAV